MKFYKIISDNYIICISIDGGMGEEITEKEYNEIFSVIQNKPATTETIDYHLKTDLTWEQYQIDPPDPDPDPEIDDAEALEILFGGAI